MKARYCYFVLLFFLIVVLTGNSVKGQDHMGAIIKFGINPCGEELTAHFEIEKYFKKAPYLTHGPGIDFMFFGYGRDVIYRYNFAIYPLYGLGNKGPYNWFYIGTGPVFYHSTTGPTPSGDIWANLFGPGLSAFTGVQFVLKKRFTIGADFTFIYFMNLEKGDHAIAKEYKMLISGTCAFKFGFIIQ